MTSFFCFQSCVTLFCGTYWLWSDKVLWFPELCDIVLVHILMLKWQGFVVFKSVWHYSAAHSDVEVTRFCDFQNCVTAAKDWEKKLEGLARLWKSLIQRQQQLDEWLDTAQAVIDDNEDDTESLIRKHKVSWLHRHHVLKVLCTTLMFLLLQFFFFMWLMWMCL